MAATALVVALSSCGSSKQAANADYYNNPQQATTPQPQKLETLEVDRLAAEETDKLRAVGTATDIDEMDARREALQNGQLEIASLLESSIIALTQRYAQENDLNRKTLEDEQRKDFVEISVAQNISTHSVGVVERFLNADGSYKVYRCVELTKRTDEVLGNIYNDLVKEEIIGLDYDKQKFIQDNFDKIKELREQVK